MFAESLLLLYASAHRTLCADISAQILYDICNSSLCAINYLRRSLRMTSLCLACAVGRPHFHYSKGSFSFCSIDYSLLLNHSPSEWFSSYKKKAACSHSRQPFYFIICQTPMLFMVGHIVPVSCICPADTGGRQAEFPVGLWLNAPAR